MIDLLIVARGNPEVVASTRYRIARYLPFLSKAGVRHKMILPPRRKKVFFYLWPLFFLRIVFHGACARTILVQKDIYLLAFWKGFKRLGKRIVYDFDDAIFLEGSAGERHVFCLSFPRRHPSKLAGEMIRLSDNVIVANRFLLDFASRYTSHVELIPMAVNFALFPQRIKHERASIVIGWVGTAQTAPFLGILTPVFQHLNRKFQSRIEIRMITPAKVPLDGVDFEQREWSLAREADDILSFDIGVVPLPLGDQLAEGKSSYKLLQFMAAGLPVVSSRVGYNKDIVVDGENGFLVSTTAEWIEALERLIEDADLRRRIGAAASETIRQECSLETLVPRFLSAVVGFPPHSRAA